MFHVYQPGMLGKLPATWLLSTFLCMFTVCSLYVHYIFTMCSLYIHYMFTICSLCIHYMFTIYSLYTTFSRIKLLHQLGKLPATRLLSTSLYLFTICSLYVHYMFTMFTVCSLYVYYIFTIRLLYIHYIQHSAG